MRRTLTRDFYMPSKELITDTVERNGLVGVVYYYSTKANIYAVAFQCKKAKPTWHYRFKTEDQRETRTEDFFAMLQRSADYKVERKLEKQKQREDAKTAFKNSDILVSSWGYEQTNINFYQITEVKGCKIKIKEICSQVVEGSQGHDCCRVKPVKDMFIQGSEEMVKMVNNPNYVRMNSYSSASRTTETESHYKSWGY